MIELPGGRLVTSDEPVDLITKMGAATLFGLTADAVRTATIRGHVRTHVVLRFANRYDRLLDFCSAERYWRARTRSVYYERDLADMRDRAYELLVKAVRYRLLHPWPLVETEPACPHRSEWPALRRRARDCGSSERSNPTAVRGGSDVQVT